MMFAHDERFDELFIRESMSVRPQTAVSSFLHRKTDFYHVHGGVTGETYAAGFAPGQAERMVVAAFRRWPSKPLAGSRLEERRKVSPPPPPKGKASRSGTSLVRYTDEGKQIPIGNGGVASSHTWTQTLAEATVYFEVPEGTRAKDVRCAVATTSLDVVVPNAHLVSGELYDRVVADDSMWTLDRSAGRASLVVTLEKTRETWWSSVFKDADPKERIDTTKVDSTKRMDEYDDQTQATIRKIMFDQQQKARGLPTSEEITTNELLDKVKHLPGSPFFSDVHDPEEPAPCESQHGRG